MTDPNFSPAEAKRTLDPLALAFSGATFNLFDLYRANIQAGGGVMIEGRTFTDCVIDGPALMLVLEGTHFESTNFGPTGGDMRNMLFKPMGAMGIGAIPVRNCSFTRCQFQALGITGNEALLTSLIEQVVTTDSDQD